MPWAPVEDIRARGAIVSQVGEGVNQDQTIREKLPTPVIVERLAERLVGYP